MSGVAVELWTLAAAGGVLDGKEMQPQLVRDELQICQVRGAKIYPHHRGHVFKVLGHSPKEKLSSVKTPLR